MEIKSFEGVANILTNDYSLHTNIELEKWLKNRKKNQYVAIKKIPLHSCTPWVYSEEKGQIRTANGSFFQIGGIHACYPDGNEIQQPIIIQNEIGFLGIICKKINNVWHFLMQAKIEPGNINYVQISPTIQATKSNFTRQHGGKEPAYLSYFMHMSRKDILVDQIQSEQSSRFWGKRNRNVIIKTEEVIEETDSHKWMTMSQLKHFMSYDNLINMDTRTVLSCIPFVFLKEHLSGYSKEFVNALSQVNRDEIVELYLHANNYKMFKSPKISFVPLKQLRDWEFTDAGLKHKSTFPFEVVFCNLEIEGREVTKWNQPLFAATGKAVFGLICTKDEGKVEILVQLKPEIGCFDSIELGPTVQEEYGSTEERDAVANWFFSNINTSNKIIDVVLSEEGGRFYHEQNRNLVMMVSKKDIDYDPKRYVWTSAGTLNALTQLNNCLNIQLRNLMMLLSMHTK